MRKIQAVLWGCDFAGEEQSPGPFFRRPSRTCTGFGTFLIEHHGPSLIYRNRSKIKRMENRADVVIVGAGILGLAHAYEAARRGLRVLVFERNLSASGASVRNFGMIWPVGQPPGLAYETALRSRARWLEVLEDSRLPYWPDGSLHVVYRDDEADVAREFAEIAPGLGYKSAWLNAGQIRAHSNAVQSKRLIGG